MTAAEIFKKMIETRDYRHGDFMCSVLRTHVWKLDEHGFTEGLPIPHPWITDPIRDTALAAIREFMLTLVPFENVYMFPEDARQNYNMATNPLANILTELSLSEYYKISRANCEFVDRIRRSAFEACFRMYSDWDNRAQIAEQWINSDHEH